MPKFPYIVKVCRGAWIFQILQKSSGIALFNPWVALEHKVVYSVFFRAEHSQPHSSTCSFPRQYDMAGRKSWLLLLADEQLH